MYEQMIVNSIKITEWPPLLKELPTRLSVCSPCIMSICNFNYFPFWFDGRILHLIVPVIAYFLLS